MTKSGRHYTNDRIKIRICVDFSTQDISIAAIETFPKSIADDDAFGKPLGLLFFRSEYTTKLSMRAEQGEVIRTNGQQFDSFRSFRTGEIRVHGPDRGDLLEDTRTLLQIFELVD